MIGHDLTELFNYLTTGFKPNRNYKKILKAPKGMKKELLEKIEKAIKLHTSESPSLLQFKMNALEEPRIVRALYEASQAGVKVDLIIRDSCRLRPGIPGLSENVRVVSVVGALPRARPDLLLQDRWRGGVFHRLRRCHAEKPLEPGGSPGPGRGREIQGGSQAGPRHPDGGSDGRPGR